MNNSTFANFTRNDSSSFENNGFSNAAGILYISVMAFCGLVWVIYFKCYKKRFVTKTKGIEWETASPREKEYEVKSYFKIIPNNADSEISIIDPTCKKKYGEPDFTMPGLIAETPEAEAGVFGLSSETLEYSDSDANPKYLHEEFPYGPSVSGKNKY